MEKIEVHVEEVEKLRARLNEIDRIPFDSIQWMKDGKPLQIDPKVLDDWKFIGLSNSYFVVYDYPAVRASK